jgi:hypothetical protein
MEAVMGLNDQLERAKMAANTGFGPVKSNRLPAFKPQLRYDEQSNTITDGRNAPVPQGFNDESAAIDNTPVDYEAVKRKADEDKIVSDYLARTAPKAERARMTNKATETMRVPVVQPSQIAADRALASNAPVVAGPPPPVQYMEPTARIARTSPGRRAITNFPTVTYKPSPEVQQMNAANTETAIAAQSPAPTLGSGGAPAVMAPAATPKVPVYDKNNPATWMGTGGKAINDRGLEAPAWYADPLNYIGGGVAALGRKPLAQAVKSIGNNLVRRFTPARTAVQTPPTRPVTDLSSRMLNASKSETRAAALNAEKVAENTAMRTVRPVGNYPGLSRARQQIDPRVEFGAEDALARIAKERAAREALANSARF